MYHSHPCLNEPSDTDQIWRYMSFPKFISLLEFGQLYFTRINNLEDPYEGVLPRKTVDRMREVLSKSDRKDISQRRLIIQNNIDYMTGMRPMFAVSCWHMGNSESDSMWNRYIDGSGGIAVKSTFGHFKDAVASVEHAVYGCLVEYIDYDNTDIDEMNAFNWVKYKRLEFMSDREFRGVLMLPGNIAEGVCVDVGVEVLIDEVIVSPKSDGWVVGLVKALLRKYEINASVHRSRLSNAPGYLAEK